MIVVTDGLGRELYVMDGKDRLHPFTCEKVEDDFVFEYTNTNLSIGVLPFIILGSGGTMVCIIKLLIN